jgi:hypothetical protein
MTILRSGPGRLLFAEQTGKGASWKTQARKPVRPWNLRLFKA